MFKDIQWEKLQIIRSGASQFVQHYQIYGAMALLLDEIKNTVKKQKIDGEHLIELLGEMAALSQHISESILPIEPQLSKEEIEEINKYKNDIIMKKVGRILQEILSNMTNTEKIQASQNRYKFEFDDSLLNDIEQCAGELQVE